MKNPVELTITLEDNVWAELVELSRQSHNVTPAETVERMILEQVKIFLYGKMAQLASLKADREREI